ncbi:hypothetical protein [Rhodopseudomonas boonkerdii]|nr:hypothetical protein [Rhodopseudomonas boonkerdii]
MRSTSGIDDWQSLNTSGVHARRCCGVPCDQAGWADAAEVKTKAATAIR